MLTTYFNTFEPLYTTDEDQLYITDANGNPSPVGDPRVELDSTTGNITASITAGYVIDDVFIQETAGHAVTGGIRIGTTSGAADIATAIAVGANSFTRTLPGALNTSGPFSATDARTIFIQAVSAWNSASVNIVIVMRKALRGIAQPPFADPGRGPVEAAIVGT